MRINGDFEEQVTREFASRRGSMESDLSRLGPQPSGSHRAVPPAVPMGADAVQISPEARSAAARQAPPDLLLKPFPSPEELIAALRAVLSTEVPAEIHQFVRELSALLGRLAAGLPGSAPSTGGDQPPALLAVRIVRLLLGGNPGLIGGGITPEQSNEAAALLRELFALPAAQPATLGGPPTAFERAAAAILLAVVRWRGQILEPSPALPGAGLPPALHSLAGTVSGQRPRKRRRRMRPEREEPQLDQGDEPASELDYRSSPRRT